MNDCSICKNYEPVTAKAVGQKAAKENPDVVQVVRCKDCRFCMDFKDKSDGFYGHCRIWITRVISDHAALVDADDYCSNGERKEVQG